MNNELSTAFLKLATVTYDATQATAEFIATWNSYRSRYGTITWFLHKMGIL